MARLFYYLNGYPKRAKPSQLLFHMATGSGKTMIADKILFQYDLKQFREEGYSKEVQVLQTNLPPLERMVQAVILSHYRHKLAEKHNLALKPVILMKSRTIKESEEHEMMFKAAIHDLDAAKFVRFLHSVMEQLRLPVIHRAKRPTPHCYRPMETRLFTPGRKGA